MTIEQKPTVAAVLLAAGESTRMGESKALLPWTGGEPLVAYHVRALHEAGYAPIVVVVGHEAERVVEALPEEIEVLALYNSRYQQGRTSSIVTGVLELADPSTDGLLLISVDQPRSVAMLRQLREAWEAERPFLAIPSLDHKAGHPPLFDGGMIPELLQVTEEQEGLRQVMQDFADQRFFVNVDDPLTLTNLNTRDEYEAALKIAAG